MVPYYDVFGLEQLVMTLSTPCYNAEADGKLLGVASVDFTVSDIFASAEYFTQGDLSYAFVIDRDGLVLLHPLLPFPSTTSAAVYLDISTLEPQPGFELIRESMINGSSGSMELESRAILSRGRSIHHGLHFLTIMCNYSWAPIKNTPFSVCVVVPMDAYDCHYFKDTFKAPINAQYHMLDMLLDNSGLCRHVSQYATPDYSTVALFPEAFSLNHGTEWRSESEYVQEALTSLNDWKQLFKAGILDTVAATANAEKVWLQLDHDHGNCDHGNSIHDYIAWRYIASSSGVMRIYPGTQIDTTGRKANQYPWYHNAVADVDSVSISPPHHDTIRTGHTVSLSKAIVRKCDSKDPKVKWLKCGVEAVMGMDVAHGHLWKLLLDTVEICRKTKYRCMLIDSNAYVIVHPRFFNNPDSVTNLHLSAFEPFLMHNMYHLKLVNRVYCNNFQYNSEFTRRPRKQFFYELTKKVRNATAPLEGGGISQCVFYSIVPVEGTNTFFVVVDNERSSDPICKPVSCPCDPEQPCSSLPGFCMCPCVEEIPPENYNSCLESFTGLCAHVCPPLTGLQDHSVTMVTNPIDEGVKACYPQNCSQKATPLDCLSNVVCEVVTNVLKNGTLNFACREIGFTAPTTKAGSERGENNEANNALIWPIVSGVLLLALLLTVFCSVVHCVRGRQVARRVRPGRGRVNTASTNMTSVTDSSVENSLRRQDSSQEHSCSSEEALPSVAQDGTSSPGCGGHKMNMVPSIATCGSYVTAAENGGIVNTAGGKEDRGRQEGEGKCSGDDVFPPQQKDDNDQKTTGSFPSSLGTTGTHDLFSKLGESPDPSKAGGIWF
jgi:hypothetical protein